MKDVSEPSDGMEAYLSTYRSFAADHPLNAEAHRQLGFLLRRIGRDGEALDPLIRASVLNPHAMDVRAAIDTYHLDEAAIDKHVLAVLTSGEDPPGRPLGVIARLLAGFALRRARRAARRKDWRMAQQHYLTLTRHDPDLAGAHLRLGHAYLQQEAAREALDSYRRALLLTPRDPDISMQIGHVLKRLGRTDSAFFSYLAAWRARPGLAAAADELRALRSWIDHEWLQAATYGDPPLDRARYFAMRAAQTFLREPMPLEPVHRLYFQFLVGSLGSKS